MFTYFDEDPVKFAQSTCVWTDDKNNVFRIFVTGPTKELVRDFVKNKIKTGEVKIDVEIVPDNSLPERFQGLSDPEYGKAKPEDDNEDFLLQLPSTQLGEAEVFLAEYDEIKLGISRVRVNMSEFDRIIYRVDPDLALNEVRYSGYNGDKLQVLCSGPAGIIHCSLFEKMNLSEDRYHERRTVRNASPGVQVYFEADRWFTGEWLIKVQGGGNNGNTYELDYIR